MFFVYLTDGLITSFENQPILALFISNTNLKISRRNKTTNIGEKHLMFETGYNGARTNTYCSDEVLVRV